MSEYSPEVVAAVQAQLAEQAAAAGVGAAQPAQTLDLAAAATPEARQAQQTDVDALLAQLQKQQADLQTLIEQARAANVVPEPAVVSTNVLDYLDHNLPAWVHTVMGLVETRLAALEANL